jgi:hypothetical protein
MRRLVCALMLSSFGAVDAALAQERHAIDDRSAVAQRSQSGSQMTNAPGPIVVSATWRNRVELWNWFGDPEANAEYGFMTSLLRVGAGQKRQSLAWQIEAAQPAYLGAPDDGLAPAPRGALGMGAGYFATNDRQTSDGGLFLKQAFVQFDGGGRSTLKLGRFEFFDGTEAAIPNATVAGLVQSRVAHRLISNFAFPVGQRSVDGALFSWRTDAGTVTGFAARPTGGGLYLNGWKELDIQVYYGAYNRTTATNGAGSFRAFGVGYVDRREAAVKPDNRPAPSRAADREAIAITTFGADYVHVFDAAGSGVFDVVGWAAVQTGSWGALSQRAASAFGEIGWQPREQKLRPWLRAGYRYSSGDGDAEDGRHGTFYQMLGATRQYSRFPFYNMMNVTDAYGLFAVRPSPKVTVRSELHALGLASGADLWYSGGGPGESDSFGYGGRPSYGGQSLATAWDLSVDTQLVPHLGVNLYYGHASGRDVIAGTYPDNASSDYGYIETVVRF